MDNDTKAVLVCILAVVILVSFLLCNIYQTASSTKNITIEDKVVDVDVSHTDYMIVTFENGEAYNIRYSYGNNEIDFTVNSKMKIKLTSTSCWIIPNNDNVWSIVQIVKIPS